MSDGMTHGIEHKEPHSNTGGLLRDIILGGQDGVVNVLGLVLGVAAATSDPKIVIIAGLASTFAESLSMGAVAYTSTQASKHYYESERQRELWEIENKREAEIREIHDIFKAKGFKGKLLDKIVKHITSNKKLWLETMMKDELGLGDNFDDPLRSGLIVGFASVIGSIIPIVPFFFMPVADAMVGAFVLSVTSLFVTGYIKGKITIGREWRSGFEMAAIGSAAAIIGYLIGKVLGVII